MLKYLYKFLGLCWHEYEIKGETDILGTRLGAGGRKYIIGYLVISGCKHCNKLKQERFYADGRYD